MVMVLPTSGATPYVHRVVALEWVRDGRVSATTRGDANDQSDAEPFLLPAKVLRVDASIPWLGRAVSFLVSREGLMAAIVIVPSLLLARLAFRRRAAEEPGERLT